jgi:glutathione S-transferase
VEIEDMPNLKAWIDRIAAREAVKIGLAVPEADSLAESLKDPAAAEKKAAAAREAFKFTK